MEKATYLFMFQDPGHSGEEKRARMPSKGLRGGLEEPLGCSGGEGYRSLDNVSFCLGSLGIDALIWTVGTPLLR